MESTHTPLAGNRTPERWNTVPIPERVALRAYTNVDKASTGCWISRYSTASHGYAQIGWQEKPGRWVVLAHRAAWVHVNGQLPLGMTIDHLCKERRCVNPEHLRLLPNFENARRINGNDWPLGGCKRGHSNEHLHPVKRKSKSGELRWGATCRECMRLSRRRWEERHPGRKKLARDRSNWRRRHPGEPVPSHLLSSNS